MNQNKKYNFFYAEQLDNHVDLTKIIYPPYVLTICMSNYYNDDNLTITSKSYKELEKLPRDLISFISQYEVCKKYIVTIPDNFNIHFDIKLSGSNENLREFFSISPILIKKLMEIKLN